MKTLQHQIKNCTTLNELRDVLNSYEDSGSIGSKLGENCDLTDLPTFGGSEPSDTDGIFSWDGTRYLIPSNAWELIEREQYDIE